MDLEANEAPECFQVRRDVTNYDTVEIAVGHVVAHGETSASTGATTSRMAVTGGACTVTLASSLEEIGGEEIVNDSDAAKS